MFKAVSETLKEVAARRLSANIGFTAVLHTWGQTLTDHAHIHVIVPGGGVSLDGAKWISTPQNYLLPVKVLAKVFRGKFLNYLEKAYPKLDFPGRSAKYKDKTAFKSLLIQAAKKDWIVYAKAPFRGPNQVIDYLGNYTHRIAISNHRILNIEGDQVTFHFGTVARVNWLSNKADRIEMRDLKAEAVSEIRDHFESAGIELKSLTIEDYNSKTFGNLIANAVTELGNFKIVRDRSQWFFDYYPKTSVTLSDNEKRALELLGQAFSKASIKI